MTAVYQVDLLLRNIDPLYKKYTTMEENNIVGLFDRDEISDPYDGYFVCRIEKIDYASS